MNSNAKKEREWIWVGGEVGGAGKSWRKRNHNINIVYEKTNFNKNKKPEDRKHHKPSKGQRRGGTRLTLKAT